MYTVHASYKTITIIALIVNYLAVAVVCVILRMACATEVV